MSILVRVLAVAMLMIASYYALLFLGQRQLLFPRPRGPVGITTIRDVQHIVLRGPDTPIHTWYAAPRSTDTARHAAIVFAHGNGERAEQWLDAFGDLQDAGIGVLIVEYPGYGIAEGAPSETSITNAVVTAYDWLREQVEVDTARIVAYGRSLGGGAATRLGARRPVAALILESSFTSVRTFAGRFCAPGFLVRDPFDNIEALRGYGGPLLVLHGDRDEIAPPSHGRALAAAVPGATFISLPCGHNDCDRPWGHVLAFLKAKRLLDPHVA